MKAGVPSVGHPRLCRSRSGSPRNLRGRMRSHQDSSATCSSGRHGQFRRTSASGTSEEDGSRSRAPSRAGKRTHSDDRRPSGTLPISPSSCRRRTVSWPQLAPPPPPGAAAGRRLRHRDGGHHRLFTDLPSPGLADTEARPADPRRGVLAAATTHCLLALSGNGRAARTRPHHVRGWSTFEGRRRIGR